MSALVVHSRHDLAKVLADLPRPLALVPTMGALHAGHASLVAEARKVAASVVVSVFVNPLQFGDAGDLDRYPRTLDADVALVGAHGGDVVWAPSTCDMYPDGDPLVRVSPGPAGSTLEGASRPGHFEGMLTVVTRLFGLVRPDLAFFGEKDAQQLVLVKRAAKDLELGVRVVGVPIVRAADGLALSSRNIRLSPAEREAALAIPRALATGSLESARAVLAAEPGLVVDYVEVVDPDTFASATDPTYGILCIAASAGSTRLIDNTTISGDL